ncbi:MAG: helix-turn-helix domain-containing protein [Xanthomonadaceae bacterium]|nr:helix-turn-helix domain-containing protein [Xanthomonadaceae bacterium]
MTRGIAHAQGKAIRFSTLEAICTVLGCQPAIRPDRTCWAPFAT